MISEYFLSILRLEMNARHFKCSLMSLFNNLRFTVFAWKLEFAQHSNDFDNCELIDITIELNMGNTWNKAEMHC